MTALSLATWMGRPGPRIAPTAQESEELRALASIETGSVVADQPWEVIQIAIDCQKAPDALRVTHHQHQVQLKFVSCPQLEESPKVELVAEGQELVLFASDRPGLMDSEILQLKEGTNTVVLRWGANPAQSLVFQIKRSS